jgi:xeroderma pigmentosum group C-complementing protein
MNESISSDGLIQAAISRSGSRDVGAWLFTALLRSVGVETRLVCSLQPLKFGFVNEGPRQEFHPEIQPTTEHSVTEITRENSHISISSTDTPSEAPASRTVSKRKPAFPSSSLRQTGTYRSPAEYLAQTKTYSPNHPFFWSEAWDVASQKWITVEPMVGAKVNQPSRIEPPGTAAAWESGTMGDNILSYAIALDNSTPLTQWS